MDVDDDELAAALLASLQTKQEEDEIRAQELTLAREQRRIEELRAQEQRRMEELRARELSIMQENQRNQSLGVTALNFLDEDEQLRLALEESLRLAPVPTARTVPELWEIAAGKRQRKFRMFLECPGDAGGLVVGKSYRHAVEISRNVGQNCIIRFLKRADIMNTLRREMGTLPATLSACLIVEADTEEAVQVAERSVADRISNLFSAEKTGDRSHREVPARKLQCVTAPATTWGQEVRRHVFVDNSNLYIGAQNGDFSVRVNIKKLPDLFCRGKEGQKIVAGSKPPARAIVWQLWDDVGFRVKVLTRDADTAKEDGVDDFLHAQMYHTVAERRSDAAGANTMVLVTGDGNANDGYANFVDVVRYAAESGWRVEVWGWDSSLSRKFRTLVSEFSDGRFTVHFLDAHKKSITFQDRKQRASTEAKVSVVAAGEAKGGAKGSAVEEEDYDECVICLSEPRTHATVPCFHLCLCEGCTTGITKCPLCMTDLTAMQRIY